MTNIASNVIIEAPTMLAEPSNWEMVGAEEAEAVCVKTTGEDGDAIVDVTCVFGASGIFRVVGTPEVIETPEVTGKSDVVGTSEVAGTSEEDDVASETPGVRMERERKVVVVCVAVDEVEMTDGVSTDSISSGEIVGVKVGAV